MFRRYSDCEQQCKWLNAQKSMGGDTDKTKGEAETRS